MFQFTGLASFRIVQLHCTGLSHSEICGSNACVQLPAAYRSLPRPSSPLEPRHPPCALICFKNIQILSCLTTLKTYKDLDKSYSVLQLFFPICQRTSSVSRPPCFQDPSMCWTR